jgi:hypothetical protein
VPSNRLTAWVYVFRIRMYCWEPHSPLHVTELYCNLYTAMIFSCGSVSYDIVTPRVSGFVKAEGRVGRIRRPKQTSCMRIANPRCGMSKAYVATILLKWEYSRIDGREWALKWAISAESAHFPPATPVQQQRKDAPRTHRLPAHHNRVTLATSMNSEL